MNYLVYYRLSNNEKGRLVGSYNTMLEAHFAAQNKGLNGLDGIIVQIPQDDITTLKNIASNCEKECDETNKKLWQIEEIVCLHLNNEYVTGVNRDIFNKILSIIHKGNDNG